MSVGAGLVSIGAGVYLLQAHSVGQESNWFEVIGHGMGAYFIAKGLYMWRSLYFQEGLFAGVKHRLERGKD